MLGARFLQHIFKSFDVIAPIIALLLIGFADLPLARWVAESLRKPGGLFLFENVQKKFEDSRLVLANV